MRVIFYSLFSFAISSGLFSEASSNPAEASTNSDTEYTLVWSDEFDVDGALDPGKWFHQTFAPANGSWFNGEEQHYTDRIENSFVENGVLKIVAKKETFNNGQSTKEYTSARLNSKYAFTYGRVDVRAKLPAGRGTWPAIWTLGQNINETGAYWQTQGFATTDWPATGEIDIMEHWGDSPNIIHWSNHTPAGFGGNPNTNKGEISNVSGAFHEYSIIWNEDEIVYLVDDVVKHTYNPSNKSLNNWPFDEPQFILLNVAMGGIFQSEPRVIDPNFVESAMEIDYVRVYEESIPLTQDSRLSDLKINGETISGFNINRSDYTYFLSEDQSTLPAISYTLINENSTVNLLEATTIPSAASIEVTSEDGSDSRTYTVNFKRPLAVPIDFESNEIAYEFVNFGGGFAEVVSNPAVATFNSSTKVVRNVKFEGEDFAGVVLPVDQNIDFTQGSVFKLNVYAPRIAVPLTLKLESPTGSNELVRSTLKANEWEVIGFDFVGLEKGDYDAITLIWDNGTVGDGSGNWTFFIDDIEVVDEIGTNSSLERLAIDNVDLSSFDPSLFSYNVELPAGAEQVPAIAAVATDQDALVLINEPLELPGTASIQVVAEDRSNVSIYEVAFTVEGALGLSEDLVTVYPNPTSKKLTITLRDSYVPDKTRLSVVDVSGRVYSLEWSKAERRLSADISELPPGVYFINLGFDKVRFVKR